VRSTSAIGIFGESPDGPLRADAKQKVMKESAGTLLYRWQDGRLEVLLVHPSGNYNRKAPWGIAKGMPEEGEDLETAARRETIEEADVTPGKLVSLSSITYQKSRKRVHCFAGEAPIGSEPRCASWEIDQAAFLPVDEARRRIHPDQSPFLDRLIEFLGRT
jgi:predicted NUDIX family NTP pyrophosphohydrolase